MYVPETRELTYFVAVAEERHFGRAAQRLGIAQPPLSRAIRRLEQRLGTVLLERTTRSVRLTAAGEVLLAEGRKAIAAVTAASNQAQAAGRARRRLRVVTKPEGDAGLLEEILPRHQETRPAVEVDLLVCKTGEQADLLREGRADAGFLHPPHDDLDGFETEPLLVQGQLVMLPRGHRLAGQTAIELADLDDEPLPVWPPMRPRDADGPAVRDPGQLTALVALGQMVAVVPESVRRFGRSDIVYAPVLDAQPSRVVLAWRSGAPSPALTAFREVSIAVAASRLRPNVAAA